LDGRAPDSGADSGGGVVGATRPFFTVILSGAKDPNRVESLSSTVGSFVASLLRMTARSYDPDSLSFGFFFPTTNATAIETK
jgi:hypothetical protein